MSLGKTAVFSGKVQAFTVTDLGPDRHCETDDFSQCTYRGSYYRYGDHSFKVTGANSIKIDVHIAVKDVSVGIGNGTVSSEDDADFNFDVSFIYEGETLYTFKNIYFDNSVYTTQDGTEFSVLMFYDEITKFQQNDYDSILMTSNQTQKGDVFDFEMQIPESDNSVGISFTRREPVTFE